jgi:hypothetical protein
LGGKSRGVALLPYDFPKEHAPYANNIGPRTEFPLRSRARATFSSWPVARAQQAAIPVIGFLSPGLPETDVGRFTDLRRGLSDAGFVEGQNLTIEYR